MRSSRRSPRRATPRPIGARDLFEGRFSEILIIFVLALIVLGPEKLPRVVSEVGRWVGRARGMARQFREQLEEEVQLEEARKAQRTASPPPVAPVPAAAESPAAEPPATAAPPPQPATGNGAGSALTPEVSYEHRDPPSNADPTAGRPAQAGGADDRRT